MNIQPLLTSETRIGDYDANIFCLNEYMCATINGRLLFIITIVCYTQWSFIAIDNYSTDYFIPSHLLYSSVVDAYNTHNKNKFLSLISNKL